MITGGVRSVVCVVLGMVLAAVARGAPKAPNSSDREASKPADAGKAPKGAESPYERAKAFYPEQIPPFMRVSVRKYDEAGEHYSVGYNRFFLLTTTACGFTAYFRPARGDAAAYLEASCEEIIKLYPEAEVSATEKVVAEKSGKKHEGAKVTFKFEGDFGGLGKRQKLLSELYVFKEAGRPSGGRFVKYRITFPADQEKAERKHLEKFLADFPWPP
jgi:hypothetical protein